MVNDQLKAGRGVADKALLTHVAKRADEALQMTLDAGAEYFPYLQQLGGHSVPRTYQTTVACGAGITQPLIKECRRLGVRMVTRAKFDSLILMTRARLKAPLSAKVTTSVAVKKVHRSMSALNVVS